jgi:hypothetical protein
MIIVDNIVIMAKKAVSITLDETNLLWLRGRAKVLAGGSLSEAVDQLIDEARAGRLGSGDPPRSVVGTIDVPDEGVLVTATEEIRNRFSKSLDRTIFIHPAPARHRASKRIRKK